MKLLAVKLVRSTGKWGEGDGQVEIALYTTGT